MIVALHCKHYIRRGVIANGMKIPVISLLFSQAKGVICLDLANVVSHLISLMTSIIVSEAIDCTVCVPDNLLQETECSEKDGWCLHDTIEKCRDVVAKYIRTVTSKG